MQVIPPEFVHHYQQLVRECSTYRSEAASPIELSHRVETMLVIVEEGMQLLSEISFITEYNLLYRMRRDLSQHLRLLTYGVNDCTVPPVALYPCMQAYTGSRGRPKLRKPRRQKKRFCSAERDFRGETTNRRVKFSFAAELSRTSAAKRATSAAWDINIITTRHI